MNFMFGLAARYRVSMATIILIAIASPTFAQAPSQAQRDAIKTQCRSDYIAHCSSVPPGGEASLQCLQKNMASLSAGCAGAVRAVQAPTAAPKATAPTPAAAPKTEATPPATKPRPPLPHQRRQRKAQPRHLLRQPQPQRLPPPLLLQLSCCGRCGHAKNCL